MLQLTVWPFILWVLFLRRAKGLVSEHRMYALEFHSHVGNCVYVHGSGRMRDKES